MRSVAKALLIVTAAASIAGTDLAQAQTTHEITVQMDAATTADDGLFTAAALAAPAGEVAQSIRKLAAGLLMEVQIAAQQRFDQGVLTLDDGSQIALQEGDRIRVKKVQACPTPEPCNPTATGAVIIPFPIPPGSGGPAIIEIYKDGVCTRAVYFPFVGHKPTVSPGCVPPPE